MEGLLHGMFGFFSVGDGVCCESDVAKLLFLQGVSGGSGSSGRPVSLCSSWVLPMDLRGDLLLRMCGENFCFPMSSSVVVLVGGGLVLAVADVLCGDCRGYYLRRS